MVEVFRGVVLDPGKLFDTQAFTQIFRYALNNWKKGSDLSPDYAKKQLSTASLPVNL